MFKLLILLTIFSIVGSEIEDFDLLLEFLSKSGSRSGSRYLLTDKQQNLPIIINNYLPNPNKAFDDSSKLPELQCATNYDCRSIPYAVCSQGKCDCDYNYILSHGKCRGLLEEACEENSECNVLHSVCKSGYCGCRTDFYALGITECKKNPVIRKLGSNCSEDFECAPRDSVCSSGTCQCLETHYSKNGNCYGFSPRLGYPAHFSTACRYIKNSVYSSGSCQCASGYIESNGQCLAELGSKCSRTSECDPPSVCTSGACQCPPNHYSKNGNCYEFSPRLGYPAHSSTACRYIKNSKYSSGSCQCASGYVESNGKCLAKLGSKCSRNSECDPPSVCTSQTCQCPPNYYSKNGQCHSKLHLPCHFDDQCKVPYSECSKGECKCKKGYAEHEQVCYGLLYSKCNDPTECALLGFTCKSGVCLEVTNHKIGKLFSSKPGTTAVYGLHLWGSKKNHDYRLGEPGYNPGPGKAGNLAWVKNFTLDRVALFWGWAQNKDPSTAAIYCRVKMSTGKFDTGEIELPRDKFCKVYNNGRIFKSKDWDVLVDLGP